MPLRVHFVREIHQPALAHLLAALQPGVTLTAGTSLPVAPDYEILVAGRPNREHFTASSALRALVIPFAGLPSETRALLRDFPHIAVHNLHHNAGAVAEMAVTLMLAAAKHIVPY
ncbi:MAG: hydroxyacid dehydrogenase, partial [Anaerolineae bacterium]